jgi:simple sugar transport system permease protein
MVLTVLAIMGHPPGLVLATWIEGAAGNGIRLAMSLQEAGPLLFTGLAAAIAFRCGVWNIGGEGQFLIGAVTMVACGTVMVPPGPAWCALPIACLLATAVAASWALVATVAERCRGVPMVLSTILLNFIAVAVVSMLVEGPLHDVTTTAPQTALMVDQLRLPILVDGTKLHIGVAFGVMVAIGLFILARWTTIGFEVRVVGLNPRAAALAGMPVLSRQVFVMALSGGLAGLGGAMQVAGVTGMLSGTPTSYGYAGIAVAMLGRLHPLGIIAAALFMGMLSTGARHLERRLAIPHDVGDVVQGVVVIAVLVGSLLASQRMLRSNVEPT